MISNSNYFNSKYPILLASMNRVSTLPLALACYDAGIFPSITVPFDEFPLEFDKERYDTIHDTLKEFKKSTGRCNLVLNLTYRELNDDTIMNIVQSYHVSHVELFSVTTADGFENSIRKQYTNQYQYNKWLQTKLQQYSKINFMERCRQLSPVLSSTAYCLRGNDAAGGTHTELNTQEMFDQQRKLTADAVLIPYGGIGTPEQVKYYLRNGAVGVAVGTLFAASKESPLSDDTKHSMISATVDSLARLSDTNQNILPLGSLTDVINSKPDAGANRDLSLHRGIYGDGCTGHIYAGRGIAHVHEIKTVKEIVEYLTSYLRD
jgi:NAD(P)H-dependent flavin oxidoreductase YrpB (nitropropane dioxygenase family)